MLGHFGGIFTFYGIGVVNHRPRWTAVPRIQALSDHHSMRKETKNGATFPVPCWFAWQERKFHELDGEQLSPFGDDRLDQPIGGHEDQQNESDDAQCHLDIPVNSITMVNTLGHQSPGTEPILKASANRNLPIMEIDQKRHVGRC